MTNNKNYVNAPKGEIRTMASDLAKVRGEEIKPKKETEAIEAVNNSTKKDLFKTPNTPDPKEDSILSLEELLPLEDLPTKEAKTPQPPLSQPNIDGLSTGLNKNIPDTDLPKFPTENKESRGEIPPNLPMANVPKIPTDKLPNLQSSEYKKIEIKPLEDSLNTADIKKEIFPDPSLEIKSEFLSDLPSLSDEKIPEKTPEEILGLEKAPQMPSAPPAKKEEGVQEPNIQTKTPKKIKLKDRMKQKLYKPLDVKPESFKLSVGKPQGPLYSHKKDMKNSKNKGAKGRSASKLLILGSVLVLFFILLGGGVYYFFFFEKTLQINNTENIQKEVPAEKIKEEPKEVEIKIPEALITPNFIQHGLTIANTETSSMQGVLSKIKNEFSANEKSITYLPIRLGSITADGEATFITLSQFLGSLNITTPQNLFEIVEENFMLYAYSPSNLERIDCQNNLISQPECYGVRLGMVMLAKENKSNELKNVATEWENLISNSNLESLILNSLARIPEQSEFITAQYTSPVIENAPSVEIRYTNLPMASYNNKSLPTTSIDFAIINEFLILSSSKKATHTMIDRILQN